MPQLQRSWVRSQHPSAQWNLRGGRWSSVEYSKKKSPASKKVSKADSALKVSEHENATKTNFNSKETVETVYTYHAFLGCYFLPGLFTKRKVERQVKVLIKNLAIFFLCPSMQFLSISFQIKLLEYFPQKQKEQRHNLLGYTDKLVNTQI